MNKAYGVLAAASIALLIGGCSKAEESSAPTEAEIRANYCEVFASLTPGVLESSENISILSDPGSTTAQRTTAIQAQLGKQRTWPYDCELPSDKERFEKFMADAQLREAQTKTAEGDGK